MPRNHKFTVGDMLVGWCLEVTSLLVEAIFARRTRTFQLLSITLNAAIWSLD
jgi:hypothetical protein